MNTKSFGEDEISLFVYADEFFFAAEELEGSKNPRKAQVVSLYLLSHSLELAYKSYLYQKGIKLKEIKKMRHNLKRLLDKCIELGIGQLITVNKPYLAIVNNLNNYYSTKQFEYMTKSEKDFIEVSAVKSIVKNTIDLVIPMPPD